MFPSGRTSSSTSATIETNRISISNPSPINVPTAIGNPAPVFRIRKALLGKAKAYASTLTQGKQTVRVRHGDDVQLDFTQVERDYLVEATTRGLVLQGVAQ